MRTACPTKPRGLPSVNHSPRSDLSHGQVPENPEEDASSRARLRTCSPETGRRRAIKGSVLQQQISSLRGSHGLCVCLVSPCSFNPISPQKGIFCVWPHLWASVNFLPAPAPDSPSCADLCRGHPCANHPPLPPWAPHSACPTVHLPVPSLGCRNELLPVAGDRLCDTEDWLIGWLPRVIIWKRSVEEKDNTAVIFKETGPGFSTCQPHFLCGVFLQEL